ncbi:hypothetical protein G6F58_013084 [Rhizopus delemar]|nr:hypothetical protein G6F58_013084 [Rhizopus delemar]
MPPPPPAPPAATERGYRTAAAAATAACRSAPGTTAPVPGDGSRIFQLITVRAASTEVVVAATEMPRLALPPCQIAPTRTARPASATTIRDMGQFVHQCAASRPSRTGHAVVQQVAAQRDAASKCTAMHLGGQVSAPAYLYLGRQGT